MKQEIQTFIAWLDELGSDANARWILLGLAEDTLKKLEISDQPRKFDALELAHAANSAAEKRGQIGPYDREAGNNDYEKAAQIVKNSDMARFLESRLKNNYFGFIRRREPDATAHIVLKKTESRGRRRVEYYLERVDLPTAEDLHQEQELDSSVEVTALANYEPASLQTIYYERHRDVKPSWISRWLFFANEKAGLHTWRGWPLFVGVLVPPLLLVLCALVIMAPFWLRQTLQPQAIVSSILTCLMVLGVAYLIFKPWKRILDDRIGAAPMAVLPMGESRYVQLEVMRSGDHRYLELVRYTATCTVCSANVFLDDGAPDFRRRMVGRCSDSPREHVFSFDRVTMQGRPLCR